VINNHRRNPSLTTSRLLSYHNSAEEATQTARSFGEQLGKDVTTQIATSVGALGQSVDAKVTLATLRGEVTTLQKEKELGNEMTKLAHEGKNSSEQREKEQAIRVDKLLEQLAEATKRQEQTSDTTSSPRPGLDAQMLLNKYLQANSSFNAEQAKVNQKDSELYHKSVEILALNERLKTLQAESEASRSGLADVERQHEKLQEQADAAVQENITVKEKLKNLASASIEAGRVPKLVEELAEKDAKLAELQQQAIKLQELVQVLASKDAELNKLRLEVAKVPALVEDLTGRDTELTRVKLEAAKVPELNQQLVDQETEILKLREQISTMSGLREKVVSNEAELNELRPKAAQFVGTASQNMVLQSQIHGYKNTIQALEQQLASLGAQLGRMKQAASEVVDVQKENTALRTKAEKVEQTIQHLESELRKVQRSAQEAEDLKKEVATLRVNWRDYDQLKQDLTTQQDLHAKQVARLDEMKSKLDESQATSNQVTELQGQVEELCQKCANLNQQLSEATQATESYQAIQNDLEQKNDEIASLKSKVQKFEETSRQLIAAQEEAQQKTMRLSALQEQITKLQLESQELSASTRMDITPVNEEPPTQKSMLDLGDMLDQEEQAHASQDPAATLQSTFSPMQQDTRGEKTNQNTTRASKDVPRSNVPPNGTHETETGNNQQPSLKLTADVDSIQQIPDSQPEVNIMMQKLLATSSPLSEIETTNYFDRPAGNTQKHHGTVRHSLPPSSSYGGDSMLLEDFEAMEGMIDSAAGLLDQRAAASLSQLQSQKRTGYGHVSSRTVIKNSGTGSESRQVRTRLQSPVIEETQSQEQRPSGPDVPPSSPAGPMKHLPNSAIKRPRLDPIEATQSTQESGKRLKRTPANLDVATASKRPMSSSTQITDPDSARPTSVSLPSGSRKGSVIGANAPAPGRTRVSRKTSRKGSKSNRYAERFSNE
jgi:chromosome segregation ATPase